MTNNGVNNQIKINRQFGLCRYIVVVFGVILLSTWTVKSASIVNSTKQVLQQDFFKEITGVVKNQDGEPISGVIVLKVGTNQGTDTDIDGRYSLNANEGDKIQFVYEGFKTTTATVNQSNILNITMIEDSVDLSDIVVDKYRTVSKEEIGCGGCLNHNSKTIEQYVNEQKSTSVSTITPEMLKCRFGVKDFISTLKEVGFMAKGQMISLDFSKRYNPSQRNPETILKDVEALTRNGNYTYVVDGVRVSEETFRSLNQNDVESVDIYKHTDVYTARFGNKENQSRISLNAR